MRTNFSSDRYGRLDQNGWHVFRNDSGETVPPYALLRITGTASAHGRTAFTCEKPDTSFQRLYGVNGPTGVDNGRFGQLTYGPDVVVRYETGTPAVNESWGAKNGQWGLESGRPGFTIAGTFTHSSLNIVEAYQQPVDILTAKADAQIAVDGTADCSVHFEASSATASEYNVTGHLKWMHNSEVVSSGKQVLLQWVDGQWLVTGAECE